MTMILRLTVLFSLIFISTLTLSYAQGCSDAGFCTMGAMRPNQPFQKKINLRVRSASLTQYVGLTKFDDTILSYIAEMNFSVGEKWQTQIKLPYMLVYGPLANTHGVGDISLSLTRNLVQKDNYQLNATIGTKIPTNDANFKNADGLSLPMYYQSSLGTYDAIAGMSLLTKNFLFAAGVQYAFNEINNGFKWGIWQEHPQTKIANMYPVAQNLKRGTDVMLRAEYTLRFSKWNMNAGLLPIYRITPDEITSPQTGQREKIKDSEGLALSGLLGGTYHFSVRSNLKFIVGRQLYRRYKNPDGLSREWVNTITYEYRF